jgi:hypothetical protein
LNSRKDNSDSKSGSNFFSRPFAGRFGQRMEEEEFAVT